jgi:hypothetical protein
MMLHAMLLLSMDTACRCAAAAGLDWAEHMMLQTILLLVRCCSVAAPLLLQLLLRELLLLLLLQLHEMLLLLLLLLRELQRLPLVDEERGDHLHELVVG